MTVTRICCYIEGFEDYAILIGALLSTENGSKEKVRKSANFQEKVNREIKAFREIYENTTENIEKYLNR